MRRTSAYVRTLLQHLKENSTRPGTVANVEVRHDDDCPGPNGGRCTCEPEIASGPLVDRKHGRPRDDPAPNPERR